MRRIVLGLVLAAMPLCAGWGAAQQKRSLTEVDAGGLKEAIAAHKGNVVFVNLWATWCAPCVAEFPDIVKLYQKYHTQGFDVIAVSFDEQAAAAIPFLDKQKADFVNFLKSPSQDDEAFMRGLDPEWLGALPASWLFDRSGKRVFFTMGKFDPEALDARIASLLKK